MAWVPIGLESAQCFCLVRGCCLSRQVSCLMQLYKLVTLKHLSQRCEQGMNISMSDDGCWFASHPYAALWLEGQLRSFMYILCFRLLGFSHRNAQMTAQPIQARIYTHFMRINSFPP